MDASRVNEFGFSQEMEEEIKTGPKQITDSIEAPKKEKSQKKNTQQKKDD